jgi:hypothetical protein
MKGLALFGAFKGHVFPEVGQSQLIRVFIPAANIQDKATVGYFCMRNLFM